MAVPVQFAFQGGGARLALLLPVVKAILDCEKDKIIEVKRVAGTSAGAVAAALVAGRADIGSLITELRVVSQTNPDAIRELFPSAQKDAGWIQKGHILWKVGVRGIPMASEEKFSKFLDKCFRTAGIDPAISVGELGKVRPIVITFTDIVDKTGGIAAADSKLLQVVVDSCALPFVFRTSGSKVDGGIVDNLPIDYLDDREKMGEVIAIAFKEDAYSSHSKGMLSLAGALLDAAMTSKTRSVKRILGPKRVMELSPDAGDGIVVDSLDVEGFIAFMASENAFDLRYSEAVDWLKQRVSDMKENETTIELLPRVFSNPEAMFSQLETSFYNINKIAESYNIHYNITVVKSTFDVIAYSLTDKTKNDIVRTSDTLRVESGMINIYSTRLISSNSIDGGNVEFLVKDDDGLPVEFAVLTVPEVGQKSRTCVIVFLEPLVAVNGGKKPVITIVQQQSVPNFMEPLITHGADYNGIIVKKALTTELAEIGLAIPSNFPPLTLYDGTPETMKTHDIPVDHMAKEWDLNHRLGTPIDRRVPGAPKGFRSYGWVGRDLKQNDVLRVVYRRQRDG